MSGRELQPGDVFFSALIEEKDAMRRLDFAAEHWTAPDGDSLPNNWVGWWKTQIPAAQEKKVKLAPNDILFALFDELRAKPDQSDMLYVLTLLLIRRRLLKYEREEETESGRKVLIVYGLKDNAVYEIATAMPDRQRLEEIQEQLAQLLYN